MIITINEGSQYVLFLLALAGEIEYNCLAKNTALSKSYSQKVLRKMQKEKVIRRIPFEEDGEEKSLVRMRDKWAEGAVMKLSQELKLHYDLMVGKPKQRFKGSPAHKERILKMGRLVQMFYESGIQVDMLRHEHRPNDFGMADMPPPGAGQPYDMFASFLKEKTIFSSDGSLLSPEEIFSRLGSEQTCFFTSRALSNQRGQRYKNSRNLMNRMYGILVSGRTFFNVYYVTAPGEIWWRDVERQAMAITQRYRHTLYPDENVGEGAAIFYTPSPFVIHQMFFPPKKTQSRINPPDIYEKSYLLPMSENHIDIRTMLLISNYKSKLREVLLKENAVSGEEYDGKMNGYETYILLDSDMTRMAHLVPRLNTRPAIVVIHSWQKDITKTLYKNTKQIVFSAEEFESLVEELQAV